ncbi:MAG: hypothetical protein ACI9R3_005662 [Verrucomicrobiales bacterium]|jgi:hypothetical protein
MRILLIIAILAEAAFVLTRLWDAALRDKRNAESGRQTIPAIAIDSDIRSMSVNSLEKGNQRLRDKWKSIQSSAMGASVAVKTSPSTRVPFSAALKVATLVTPHAVFRGDVPDVLADALSLTDEERTEMNTLWNSSMARVKTLELRHSASLNNEIAAKSAADLALRIPQVREKFEKEGHSPLEIEEIEEIEAKMQDFIDLMTYKNMGMVKVHINNAEVTKNASTMLDQLHSDVESLLGSLDKASLATEAFAKLLLGGRSSTETTYEFHFGSDNDVHVDFDVGNLVGHEITPEGQPRPILSSMQTSMTMNSEDATNRFDHLIDVSRHRLRGEVPLSH